MTAWPSVHHWADGDIGYAAFFNSYYDAVDHLKQRSDRVMTLVAGTDAAMGDLLVPSSAGVDKVARTSVQGQAGPIYVALAPLTAGGSTGDWVRLGGSCDVNVASAVTARDFLRASATAGQAETTTNPAEAFAMASSSIGTAGTVTALLLPRAGIMGGWGQRAAAAVASAATIAVDTTSSVVRITGTTTITSITAQAAGRYVELEFASAGCQVTNGSNLKLSANYTSAVDSVLALRCDGTNWHEVGRGALGAGSGSVTSVALTVPAEFSVAGSPVTTAGTLAVSKANQSANQVYAGPTTGAAAAPAFRALVAADIPSLGYGTGTVTSVAATVPAEFSIAGSPVTTTGTLAITKANQNANLLYAGPTSGGAAAPTFRALVRGDLPVITQRGLAVGSTSGPTNTSGAFVDMTDMSVTLTTLGGDLLVQFNGAMSHSLVGGLVGVALRLDSGSDVARVDGQFYAASVPMPFGTGYLFTGVAAGSHTVKARWFTGSGTATAVGTERTLTVLECAV